MEGTREGRGKREEGRGDRLEAGTSSLFPLPSYSLLDRLEIRHDRLPPRLEERRQHHLLAERRRVLVHGEAGALGGDLEEHPVRLAEVEAPEVVAVHLAAV